MDGAIHPRAPFARARSGQSHASRTEPSSHATIESPAWSVHKGPGMGERASRPVATDLHTWISDLATLVTPRSVVICDGSDGEREAIERELVEQRSLIPLDAGEHSRSFLYRSGAEVGQAGVTTFVCCDAREDAATTSEWRDVAQGTDDVRTLFAGAMQGRTMYVVPCLLGPVGSPHARVVVQVTDSPYAVLHLRLVTRVGRVALEHLGTRSDFLRAVHCAHGPVARPHLFHFLASSELWTIGAEFDSTPELGVEGLALRLAGARARNEGWQAERMALLGLTNPQGVTHYLAAAFAEGAGATTLAMLQPNLPGWRAEILGDDCCWLRAGDDGRLWAVSPTTGFSVRAARQNAKTHPRLLSALAHDALFVDCAIRRGRRVWWPGAASLQHGEVIDDFTGSSWIAGADRPALHPSARFVARLPRADRPPDPTASPRGVPISAIVFGVRRATLMPLICESFDWRHGVYIGATMASEVGEGRTLQDDPMGMLRFCGFNLSDYFAQWLRLGKQLERPPKIFSVNWFRSGPDGRPCWPGFSANLRAIAWMFDRLGGAVLGRNTPIGAVPHDHELDVAALDIPPAKLHDLLGVDRRAMGQEAQRSRALLSRVAPRLPTGLLIEHRQLLKRLLRAAAATN